MDALGTAQLSRKAAKSAEVKASFCESFAVVHIVAVNFATCEKSADSSGDLAIPTGVEHQDSHIKKLDLYTAQVMASTHE